MHLCGHQNSWAVLVHKHLFPLVIKNYPEGVITGFGPTAELEEGGCILLSSASRGIIIPKGAVRGEKRGQDLALEEGKGGWQREFIGAINW